MINSVSGSVYNHIQPLITNGGIQYIGHGQIETSSNSFSIIHIVPDGLDFSLDYRLNPLNENDKINQSKPELNYMIKDDKLVEIAKSTFFWDDDETFKDFWNPKDTYISVWEQFSQDNKKKSLTVDIDAYASGNSIMDLIDLFQENVKDLETKLYILETELGNLKKDFFYSSPNFLDTQNKKLGIKIDRLNEMKRKIEVELLVLKSNITINKYKEMIQNIDSFLDNHFLTFAPNSDEFDLGKFIDVMI